MNTNIKRGAWDEIVATSVDRETWLQIESLVKLAGSSADEHGSWHFGCAFDRKQRGEALNWDLYALGNDLHDGRLLIVIQVRQYRKAHKNWYPSVRKNYFLVGTNEDGSAFAHSVPATAVRAAINAERDPILACQNWIFGGDYRRMIRHGDLALIPLARTPAAPVIRETNLVLADSHELTARTIRRNGNLYALDPVLTHLPGTHSPMQATGWHRVVIGERAKFWNFAAPTKD
jgi:hypothetical protein